MKKINHLKTHEEYKKKTKTGELYNFFSALNIQSNEMIHSLFLADLLNPNSTHGLGNKFHKHFLKSIGVNFINEEDINTSKIYTEYFIGNLSDDKDFSGRIDILIEYPVKNKQKDKEEIKKAIIIENKIFAPDQNRQIERYSNYGKKRKYEKFEVIYLTLNGKKAPETSHKGKQYKKASYLENVIDTLNKTSVDIINPNFKATINQYKRTLENLTSSKVNPLYKELANASEEEIIYERDSLRINFINELKDSLESNVNISEVTIVNSINNNYENKLAPLKIPSNFGVKIELNNSPFQINIEIHQWQKFIYGVFSPSEELKKHLTGKGFEEMINNLWVAKEYSFTSSLNQKLHFFDDFLNYDFSNGDWRVNNINMLNSEIENLIKLLK